MNDRNLELKKIRDLDISAAATGGRPLHLSAGSGLVRHGRAIYVIADDELHLGRFSVDGVEPGRLVRLFDGVLPDAKGARKRLKPDVEALVLMPALTGFPNGSLLAIGSGSNANRHRGALLGFDPYGDISGPPRTVDLSEFLHPLEQHFSEINIEGAVVIGDEFHFFQRGNGKQAENAIIRYPLQPFLETLEGGSAKSNRCQSTGLILVRSTGFHLASPMRLHCPMVRLCSVPLRKTPGIPSLTESVLQRP
ncbi:hypothetical protein [Sinorhizobium sp. NFACC03]|uniref:DUF6929 family protein n=1 Tax=Sinorhizobium sp. NFACC03 TaxID=1566295 RepID=UPI0015A43BD1|nr:hypothetical protein [Sinorhizobium sp. NFACC03]